MASLVACLALPACARPVVTLLWHDARPHGLLREAVVESRQGLGAELHVHACSCVLQAATADSVCWPCAHSVGKIVVGKIVVPGAGLPGVGQRREMMTAGAAVRRGADASRLAFLLCAPSDCRLQDDVGGSDRRMQVALLTSPRCSPSPPPPLAMPLFTHSRAHPSVQGSIVCSHAAELPCLREGCVGICAMH